MEAKSGINREGMILNVLMNGGDYLQVAFQITVSR